jgi:hypothetical protein
MTRSGGGKPNVFDQRHNVISEMLPSATLTPVLVNKSSGEFEVMGAIELPKAVISETLAVSERIILPITITRGRKMLSSIVNAKAANSANLAKSKLRNPQ